MSRASPTHTFPLERYRPARWLSVSCLLGAALITSHALFLSFLSTNFAASAAAAVCQRHFFTPFCRSFHHHHHHHYQQQQLISPFSSSSPSSSDTCCSSDLKDICSFNAFSLAQPLSLSLSLILFLFTMAEQNPPIEDDNRRQRLGRLEEHILDPKSEISVDSLLVSSSCWFG